MLVTPSSFDASVMQLTEAERQASRDWLFQPTTLGKALYRHLFLKRLLTELQLTAIQCHD